MARLVSLCSVLALVLLFLVGSLTPTTAQAETPTPAPQDCVPLEEALQKGLVKASFTGNGALFWLEALDYAVAKVEQRPLVLCISAGLVFVSEDSGYQNLIVGRTITITLSAGEEKKGKLHVFCANEDLSAPGAGLAYSVQGMADGDLLKVAQTIDRRRAYGRLGAQLAVWNVTDGFSLSDLGDPGDETGFDESDPTGIIRPLIGLVSGEIKLGQEILDEAVPGNRLYEGELPPSLLPDIPLIGDIVQLFDPTGPVPQTLQTVRRMGPVAAVALPLVCCILPLAGVVSAVLLRRR